MRGAVLNTEITAIAERALLVLHGSITVIFQDEKIISMEVTEKIRFQDGKAEIFASTSNDAQAGLLAKKLTKLLRGMVYGKIVLFVKNGKVIQYSRQEQYRILDTSEGI